MEATNHDGKCLDNFLSCLTQLCIIYLNMQPKVINKLYVASKKGFDKKSFFDKKHDSVFFCFISFPLCKKNLLGVNLSTAIDLS